MQTNSINTWEELVATFCIKFFVAENKPSLTDLFNEVQKKKESLTAFVNKFKERALDCSEIVSEKELIHICIKGMEANYKMHIVNHTIPNFAELIDKVKKTEATVIEIHKVEVSKKTNRELRHVSSFPKRKREVSLVELSNKERKNSQIPLEIPLEKDRIIALAKIWIEDGELRCPPIIRMPTQEEIKNPKFCIFLRKTGHATPDYCAITKVYHDKAQRGKIV